MKKGQINIMVVIMISIKQTGSMFDSYFVGSRPSFADCAAK